MANKIKIEIKSWLSGAVLFEYESENNTIKETLSRAVLSDAVLRDAVLRGADLRDADLRGAVLRDADLSRADLRGADLRGVPIENLPEHYINNCSRDMLFIFEHLKPELPGLREALVAGRIQGTQYEGDCACLIGTLGGNTGKGAKNVCSSLPYYDMGLHNPAEQWFWQIREGDTPENNDFAKHAVELIDKVLQLKI